MTNERGAHSFFLEKIIDRVVHPTGYPKGGRTKCIKSVNLRS